jgi:hypothetical protein
MHFSESKQKAHHFFEGSKSFCSGFKLKMVKIIQLNDKDFDEGTFARHVMCIIFYTKSTMHRNPMFLISTGSGNVLRSLQSSNRKRSGKN